MTGSRPSSTHLSGQGRIDIAKKIEAAREEGDLRENGGYHAAKEEQGKQEARIHQLTHILTHSKVGEPPRTDGVVGPGMTVTVRFEGDDTEDDVPARLARGERVADRRVLAEVAAWRGDLRQEGRRDRQLQPAERQPLIGRDHRRGAVRRHVAGPGQANGPGQRGPGRSAFVTALPVQATSSRLVQATSSGDQLGSGAAAPPWPGASARPRSGISLISQASANTISRGRRGPDEHGRRGRERCAPNTACCTARGRCATVTGLSCCEAGCLDRHAWQLGERVR